MPDFKLDTSRGAPAPWLQIRAMALGRIQAGLWRPGDQIPNEQDLAIACGCNRSTVSRALRDLADAGFLERRRKGGTRIAANPTRKAPLEVPIIEDAIRRAGARYGYRLLESDLRLCAEASAALAVPADRPLMLVRALHMADDRPHQLETRWIDPAAAPGIAEADLSRRGVDLWLLSNAPLTGATIRISAEAATDADAPALWTTPGAPLLAITRTSWGPRGPISWLRLLHRPGAALETAL
jgi:GntR family histidine utilization transcriptional repressor